MQTPTSLISLALDMSRDLALIPSQAQREARREYELTVLYCQMPQDWTPEVRQLTLEAICHIYLEQLEK